MDKLEKVRFIHELLEKNKQKLIKLAPTLPDEWDRVELRWLIADTVSQIVFGAIGERKGKRYRDYRNKVIVDNLL